MEIRGVARLIALEGIDGSGKGTQAALLRDALQQAGRTVTLLSFPRYKATRFGPKIGEFLNGKFGTLDQVHPTLVSLLFAGDRLESQPLIESSLAEFEFVICDRYVPSNIAHQAAKSNDRNELRTWIEFVEYDLYRLPRADLVIWLDVPVTCAQELILRKQKRSYTEQAADLQEADSAYLEQVRQVYAGLAASDPRWRRIDACPNGRLRETTDIAQEIIASVLDQHQPEALARANAP
jgi:dTMP kinase